MFDYFTLGVTGDEVNCACFQPIAEILRNSATGQEVKGLLFRKAFHHPRPNTAGPSQVQRGHKS